MNCLDTNVHLIKKFVVCANCCGEKYVSNDMFLNKICIECIGTGYMILYIKTDMICFSNLHYKNLSSDNEWMKFVNFD